MYVRSVERGTGRRKGETICDIIRHQLRQPFQTFRHNLVCSARGPRALWTCAALVVVVVWWWCWCGVVVVVVSVGGERTESDLTGPEKRKTHMRLDPGTGLTLSMHVQRSVKRAVTPQHQVLITEAPAKFAEVPLFYLPALFIFSIGMAMRLPMESY